MTEESWRGRAEHQYTAASAIAEATARELAGQGANLALVGRDGERLAVIAADLRLRGAPAVAVRVMDLVEAEPTESFFQEVAKEIGGLQVVLIAHGVLGDQDLAEKDVSEAARLLDVNFTSAAVWALTSARFLEISGAADCVVAAIGSVAGDRGRSSNFIYGAAKGGLAILMQGLAHRADLKGSPRAVIFKLGFVDTPMTQGLTKGGPLWATTTTVARVIVHGLSGRKAIVYGPWFWRYVMLIIRLLPQPVFGRIDL